MLVGVSLRPQYTDWDSMRAAATAVDQLGFDWLLTSDHLVASDDHQADPDGPIFEAWQLVAAWAAITKQVRIGVMVSGVMLRHPALLAKMAATLDHISHGRAMCGLGAGWFAQEAEMYGVPWPSNGERLARLEEAAAVCRSLFDEQRTTHHGQHYRLTDAVAAPKPFQGSCAAPHRWRWRAPNHADRRAARRHLEHLRVACVDEAQDRAASPARRRGGSRGLGHHADRGPHARSLRERGSHPSPLRRLRPGGSRRRRDRPPSTLRTDASGAGCEGTRIGVCLIQAAISPSRSMGHSGSMGACRMSR
jgi:alkanesulfonate monooxygenase SsuD/methylene tetrahydromethanopterin reductase-like flavin-dependent oxidoreductase (luciferase family)